MSEREDMVFALARLGCERGEVDTVLRALPAIQRAHEAECCAWRPETVAVFTKRGDAAFARLSLAIGPAVMGAYGASASIVRQRDPRGAAVCIYESGRDPLDGSEPVLRLGLGGFTLAQMERIEAAERFASSRVV